MPLNGREARQINKAERKNGKVKQRISKKKNDRAKERKTKTSAWLTRSKSKLKNEMKAVPKNDFLRNNV